MTVTATLPAVRTPVFFRALTAEVTKAFSQTGILVGALLLVFAPQIIVTLNGGGLRGLIKDGTYPEYADPIVLGMMGAPLASVGAVVIGVLIGASEYTSNRSDVGGGRQITTTLLAVPSRPAVLAAKAVVVTVVTAVAGAISVPLGILIANGILGDLATPLKASAIARHAGMAIAYWAMTALIAFAIGVLVRNALIPLIVLIVNSSMVSVALLLSNLTDKAFYLPDMAGARLLGSVNVVEGVLSVRTGSVVMLIWTVGFLVVAGIVFRMREA